MLSLHVLKARHTQLTHKKNVCSCDPPPHKDVTPVHSGRKASDPRREPQSPQKPVKPPNHQNPRQSCRFAWRISYPPTAILDRERKASALVGAFLFSSVVTPL